MATRTFGQLQEFQPETESIDAYLERVDMYFLANEIPAGKHVPVFLSVVGGKTHALLRDLFAPQKLQTQKLKDIYKELREHFGSKPVVIAERFYFYQRSQEQTESVSEYVAELRRLATNCKFGDFLNDALRDRFVCGLGNRATQKSLLFEKDLSLKKAVEVAQAAEAAESHANKLRAGETKETVYRTERTDRIQDTRQDRTCYRCGGGSHSASTCRFKETICNECKKRGHLARVFHQYLYGRNFVLVTDHKPLLSLLGPKKGIPTLAAARMQRWALILAAYSYTIEFKPTDEHANADGLSRLPLVVKHEETPDSFIIGQLQALPVTTERLRVATRQDPVLSRVYDYVKEGWQGTETEAAVKPFADRKTELSTAGECLLWGNRVVIPQKIQARMIEELHRDHPGVTRMKAIARSYLWWPGLDKDLENCAKSCVSCQAVKSSPAKAPLHPWMWPAKPWQRIHIDFAGPFLGKNFLVVVDAHSKWAEVIEMSSTTSSKTIVELRKLFSAYGLPEQIVSDNGPQFVAEEFTTFLKLNGIRHIRCSPYHPSSNGGAERFIQTFKQAMKAGATSTSLLSQRLSSFLLTYRATPHATTNTPPCELFIRRRIRTLFDLLLPSQEKRVNDRQAAQKAGHDMHAQSRQFEIDQLVMARNWRDGPDWVPGVLIEKLGPLTFKVQTQAGQIWKRHVDHLK